MAGCELPDLTIFLVEPFKYLPFSSKKETKRGQAARKHISYQI
jgi:hypothetical protein